MEEYSKLQIKRKSKLVETIDTYNQIRVGKSFMNFCFEKIRWKKEITFVRKMEKSKQFDQIDGPRIINHIINSNNYIYENGRFVKFISM